ncbi:YhdT family protein [Clostridium sp. AM58-1XD]|uniref:YhdT family protein n=1 Tax=Clostridium sp. AM58-1XD TaxID=2292307 RepID=UPI000E4AF93C|nr:YhdT family protein [Clostridium sp. AM58-1XD]RGY97603.1 DUF997 family protein [Clostridium sp. AM58-1XD]
MDKLPFEVDNRFKICKKEMIIAFLFQIAYTVTMFIIAYGFGGKPLSEYRFIMGFPSWFFALLVTVAVFFVLLAFLCFKYFKNMSIDAYVDEEERE